MKVFLTALAFATAVAAPALARTTANGHMFLRVPGVYGDAYGLAAGRVLAPAPYDVYVNGQFAGRDPDPNVRLEISRTFGTNR